MITDQLASVEGKPTAATWDGVQWFHDSHAGAPPRVEEGRRLSRCSERLSAANRSALGTPYVDQHKLAGVPLASWWYTLEVPTIRPRHQITETPAVAHALDIAAQRWPTEPRSKLLLRLVHAGSAVLEEGHNEMTRRRQHAIVASSGKYADAFSGDYLAELRRDWPE
jgi:hypothetical protein